MDTNEQQPEAAVQCQASKRCFETPIIVVENLNNTMTLDLPIMKNI
jgi:hypothetical protein